MTGLTRKSRGPKFSSLRTSVHTYLRTLNSHPAYQRLRVIRANLRKKDRPLQGASLAEGLTRYSELGRRYVKMVRTMIRHNDFDRYTEAKLVQPAGQEYALLFVPEPG